MAITDFHSANASLAEKIKLSPRFLWFLILSYAMVIVLANWFDFRLIHLFGLNTDAGTIIFPLTFILSDLITEVYGYKHARRAIWTGFLFNFIFIVYGQIVTHLPSPVYYAANNKIFDQLFEFNTRIIIASALSYLIAEPFNSFVMARLKIKMDGKYIAVRFLASTVCAEAIDSTVFSTIAFYHTLTNDQLISIILTMWLIKVVVELIGLPISVRLAKKLKKLERLDIYDRRTRFNLFSLNVDYTADDNGLTKNDMR